MTAEEAREYETNCTLISEADKFQYEEIMKKVSDTISSPKEGLREFNYKKTLLRRVQNKLRQDHFQVTRLSDTSFQISWEPLSTES